VFWFLKNDILNILDETQKERDQLQNHLIYSKIKTLDELHVFMENHVFAVWDFMSILKSLQSQLTCINVPWIPAGKGTPSRLVNEIVTEEESDLDRYGQYISHFEMYCHAMQQAGANTDIINIFISNLEHYSVTKALDMAQSPEPAKEFVISTFNILDKAPAHVVAAIFTFGREEVIPDMFRSIVNKIDKDLKGRLKSFIYYLDRHIGLDEDEHTPAALKMVKELCGDDQQKWNEATEAARTAMQARINLWDGILQKIVIK
tara:strand:+ start:3141 stop:3923 length:783 start_codon:yes stop_codon:yes gene_type:complete